VRVHREHYSSDRTANCAGWLRLYQKMAATTDDPGLRAHCVRMQADETLSLARAHSDKGEYRAAWTTLGHALSFSGAIRTGGGLHLGESFVASSQTR